MQLYVIVVLSLLWIVNVQATPTGNHTCTGVVKHSVTVRVNVTEPVTYRTYTWCLRVPPRCSKYTVQLKDRVKIHTEMHNRTITVCCKGYVEMDFKCVPACPPMNDCPNMHCNRTNHCYCTPGYQGLYCNYPCDRGFWGTDCKKVCDCPDGFTCHHLTGDCMLDDRPSSSTKARRTTTTTIGTVSPDTTITEITLTKLLETPSTASTFSIVRSTQRPTTTETSFQKTFGKSFTPTQVTNDKETTESIKSTTNKEQATFHEYATTRMSTPTTVDNKGFKDLPTEKTTATSSMLPVTEPIPTSIKINTETPNTISLQTVVIGKKVTHPFDTTNILNLTTPMPTTKVYYTKEPKTKAIPIYIKPTLPTTGWPLTATQEIITITDSTESTVPIVATSTHSTSHFYFWPKVISTATSTEATTSSVTTEPNTMSETFTSPPSTTSIASSSVSPEQATSPTTPKSSTLFITDSPLTTSYETLKKSDDKVISTEKHLTQETTTVDYFSAISEINKFQTTLVTRSKVPKSKNIFPFDKDSYFITTNTSQSNPLFSTTSFDNIHGVELGEPDTSTKTLFTVATESMEIPTNEYLTPSGPLIQVEKSEMPTIVSETVEATLTTQEKPVKITVKKFPQEETTEEPNIIIGTTISSTLFPIKEKTEEPFETIETTMSSLFNQKEKTDKPYKIIGKTIEQPNKISKSTTLFPRKDGKFKKPIQIIVHDITDKELTTKFTIEPTDKHEVSTTSSMIISKAKFLEKDRENIKLSRSGKVTKKLKHSEKLTSPMTESTVQSTTVTSDEIMSTEPVTTTDEPTKITELTTDKSKRPNTSTFIPLAPPEDSTPSEFQVKSTVVSPTDTTIITTQSAHRGTSESDSIVAVNENGKFELNAKLSNNTMKSKNNSQLSLDINEVSTKFGQAHFEGSGKTVSDARLRQQAEVTPTLPTKQEAFAKNVRLTTNAKPVHTWYSHVKDYQKKIKNKEEKKLLKTTSNLDLVITEKYDTYEESNNIDSMQTTFIERKSKIGSVPLTLTSEESNIGLSYLQHAQMNYNLSSSQAEEVQASRNNESLSSIYSTTTLISGAALILLISTSTATWFCLRRRKNEPSELRGPCIMAYGSPDECNTNSMMYDTVYPLERLEGEPFMDPDIFFCPTFTNNYAKKINRELSELSYDHPRSSVLEPLYAEIHN